MIVPTKHVYIREKNGVEKKKFTIIGKKLGGDL